MDKPRSEAPQAREEKIAENQLYVTKIMLELGFVEVDLFEITGVEKKKKEMSHNIYPDAGNLRYFLAKRKDGSDVKVIVQTKENDFGLDVFSQAFYEGQGGNHDSNRSEMKEILKAVIELPRY